ncbi:unnamed protein product [Lactuca virosa]|uniref:Uncharacterized protein n=1 Tax=Lactuca virosa TaxID=75947 RepID=A0AAU9PEA0_9ASTR|nr:unnamed protein product [Lactuca virosa]
MKVATIFGEVLFLDDDENETVAIGRVCIKTKDMVKIDGKVQVDINGMEFIVSVSETANWTPSIGHSNHEGEDIDTSSESDQSNLDGHVQEEEEINLENGLKVCADDFQGLSMGDGNLSVTTQNCLLD